MPLDYSKLEVYNPEPEPGAPVEGQKSPPQTSALQAGLSGAVQGATLGFADEIGAGGGALWDRLVNGKDLKESYKDRLQKTRALSKQMEDEHPTASLVGNVAGSLLVPMGSMGTAVKLISKSAAAGAASAIGSSESNDSLDLLKEGAAGAAIGGATSGILSAVGKAAKFASGKFKDSVLDVGKKVESADLVRKARGEERVADKVKAIADNWVDASGKKETLFKGSREDMLKRVIDKEKTLADKVNNSVKDSTATKGVITDDLKKAFDELKESIAKDRKLETAEKSIVGRNLKEWSSKLTEAVDESGLLGVHQAKKDLYARLADKAYAMDAKNAPKAEFQKQLAVKLKDIVESHGGDSVKANNKELGDLQALKAILKRPDKESAMVGLKGLVASSTAGPGGFLFNAAADTLTKKTGAKNLAIRALDASVKGKGNKPLNAVVRSAILKSSNVEKEKEDNGDNTKDYFAE